MRVRVTYLKLPKGGNDEDEYEDACWPVYSDNADIVLDRFRFGVADGASEGYLSRLWADCLVKGFYRSSSRRFEETLDSAMALWSRERQRYLEDRAATGRPIQWYEDAKLEDGAFATFLGVQFRSRPGNDHVGAWTAVALGDTCLFQMRGDAVVSSFPISNVDEFDTTPDLVPSKESLQVDLQSLVRTARGEWEHGDAFFLVTDAIAAWFVAGVERGEEPWAVLRDLETDAQPPFAEWIAALREQRLMRNDDVTLVRIEVD